MKVAVITPYAATPLAWLESCHRSVKAQTHPCTHILVADGEPEPALNGWDVQHIVLPKRHGDYGDTPRSIGSLSAIGQGFEAIAYLDADNWFHPQHIASLLDLHRRTGAAVCASHRLFCRLDGSPLGECPFSDGDQFIDTSCYLLTRAAFQVAPLWSLIPLDLHAIGDRLMLLWIKQIKLSRAFSDRPTLAYRTKHPGDYAMFGEGLPEGSPPPHVPNPVAVARLLFEQRTGKGLKLRPCRAVRAFDGTLWDGRIETSLA